MIVFELVHSYYIFDNCPICSLRTLGYFTEVEEASNGIKFYGNKSGYCDASKGFVIKQREIMGNVNDDIFYEAMVYAHDSHYENYEYTVELGLFADRREAEKSIESFRMVNGLFYSNSSIEIEEIINKRHLNKKYCTDGFIVEEITT